MWKPTDYTTRDVTLGKVIIVLAPLFFIQLLVILFIVSLSAWIGMRRFQWNSLIAWIYSATFMAVYLFLSYLLRDETWVRAYLLPDIVVLLGVSVSMVLAEHFWRQYRVVQTRLIQAEKMAALGQLVAGVIHELNTPIGVVKSNQDMLIRLLKKIREQVDEHTVDQTVLKNIQLLDKLESVNFDAFDRLDTIVESLKSFSRLDQAEHQHADIHECIDTSLSLLAHQFKERIHISREFGDIPAIPCYPNQLNQVFMNVLLNASQAIEGQGEIRISTSLREEQIAVHISDTGVGIPPEHLSQIFDLGFTKKDARVGLGLGLSLCYQIIQEHGGTIDIESQVGEGTTVKIILPIVDIERHAEGITHE